MVACPGRILEPIRVSLFSMTSRGPPRRGRDSTPGDDENSRRRRLRDSKSNVDEMLDSWNEEETGEEDYQESPEEDDGWQDYTDSGVAGEGSGFSVRRPEIAGGMKRALRPGEERPKKERSEDGEWKSYFDQFSEDIDTRKGQVGKDAKLGATVVLGRWTAFVHGTTAVALAFPAILISISIVMFTGIFSAVPRDGSSIATLWAMSTLSLIIIINGLSFGLAHAVGRAVTGLGQLSRDAPTLSVSAKFALVPTIGLAAPAAFSTALLILGLYFHGASIATFDFTAIQSGADIHGTILLLMGTFGVLMSVVGMVPLLVRDILLAEE